MQKTFEAVYENGVLHPLETLDLADRQHVRLTISASDLESGGIECYFEPAEWEASKKDDISLAEVRQAISSIRGSLSEAVVASRSERS